MSFCSADLRPNIGSQEILPGQQSAREGVPAGPHHDGAGLGLPRPQHPSPHTRTHGGTKIKTSTGPYRSCTALLAISIAFVFGQDGAHK